MIDVYVIEVYKITSKAQKKATTALDSMLTVDKLTNSGGINNGSDD